MSLSMANEKKLVTFDNIQHYHNKLSQVVDTKQDSLVSGSNIKTINGQSILGEGNITIESGSEQIQSDWNETDTTSPAYIANKPLEKITITNDGNIPDGEYYKIDNLYLYGVYADGIKMYGMCEIDFGNSNRITTNGVGMVTICNEGKYITLVGDGNGSKFLSNDGTYKSISTSYDHVNHGTSDTTFTLTPNTFHVWDEVASLTLTLGSETSGVANEYLIQFTSGSEPTTLILPDSIKFNSDFTVEANKIYQISILNGLGTVMSWNI